MAKGTCKINVNGLVKHAIGAAVRKALNAKPVDVHYADGAGDMITNGYLIGGEVYVGDTAVEKILGEYSWWNDKH